MSKPATALDPRFSDPNAAATSWDDTVRVLESAQLFWITTVRTDGRPHVSPLVAVWLDGSIHFTTGAAEQKAVNLRCERAHDPDHGLQRLGPRARRGHRGRCGSRDRRCQASASRRSVANEVGRKLEVRGPRRPVPPRSGRSARVRGGTYKGPRLRQGSLLPHPPRVLTLRRASGPAPGPRSCGHVRVVEALLVDVGDLGHSFLELRLRISPALGMREVGGEHGELAPACSIIQPTGSPGKGVNFKWLAARSRTARAEGVRSGLLGPPERVLGESSLAHPRDHPARHLLR